MVKKNNSLDKKEISIEKKFKAGKERSENSFLKGNSFVEEPTGSATMVNLDGIWHCKNNL